MQLTDDRPGATVRAATRASASMAAGALRQRAVPSVGRLVEAARTGSAAAFEEIYRVMAGQVASYLRWHRASDPDGLTNDVFVQVHRNLPAFSGDEHNFRSWVFTIAHHRMIDDRRRANRQVRVDDEAGVEEHSGTGDVEDDVLTWLSHDRVRELLAVLSRDQRDVVLLRIVADLSVEDVARMLDKRESAVKALQHRALNALRRHIDRQHAGG